MNRVAVDTNVLVRLATWDEPEQATAAQQIFERSDIIIVALPVLCEFCWVLKRLYRYDDQDVVRAIESLIHMEQVLVDREAVEQGIAFLRAGGDFADGIITYEGERLGCDSFVSFDKTAIRICEKQGKSAILL